MLAVAPAPRFAGMRDWSCGRCGREEVRPVFLSEDGGAPVAYGSGCAALLLGRPGSSRQVVAEAAAAARRADEAEQMLEERRGRYAAALEAFRADPNRGDPALDSCRRTYHQSGGGAVLGSFPAWLASVAASGVLVPA